MSTNFHILAKISLMNPLTGKMHHIERNIDTVWQTPTVVTKQIMQSQDKLQAYKDWVLSVSRDEKRFVYAEDDYLCEGDPVGKEVYNAGKEHLENLDEELKYLTGLGYEIYFEAW